MNTGTLCERIKGLLDDGLYASAEALISYAFVGSHEWDARQSNEMLECHADALVKSAQPRRAVKLYQLCMASKEGERGEPSFIRVQMKCAKALHASGRHNEAVGLLKGVPLERLPLDGLLALGKSCAEGGHRETGQEVLLHLLYRNPLAVEAIEPLLALGASVDTIVVNLNAAFHRSGEDCPLWLLELVHAEAQARNANEREALKHLERVRSGSFPSSPLLLSRIASLHVLQDDLAEAEPLFERAHAADRDAVAHMDHFASLLHRTRNADGLNALAQRLRRVAPERPESWLAGAYFCDLCGMPDKALRFAARASALGPRPALSEQLRGRILLEGANAAEAIGAFERAVRSGRDMLSYRGLVEAHLDAGRLNDALHTAREVLEARPKDTRALVLTGRVLARTANGAEKAIRVLRKAVSLRPRMEEAVLELAAAYMANRDHRPAAEALEDALRFVGDSAPVHARLGDAYAALGRADDALKHYHTAAAIAPDSEEARAGVERLEAALRGEPADEDDLEIGEMGDEDLAGP